MNSRSYVIVFLFAFFISGCSILKIQPEPEADDNIKITWEDSGTDQVIVSYEKSKVTGSTRRENKEKITPVTLVVDTVSSDHSALFAEIDSWMGTPYRYGKHEKSLGTDCSGFTMEIYDKVFGIKLNRSSEGQVANTVEIKPKDLQIGDLVFYVTRGQRISHVGIYVGNNKFVHATTSRGVIISDMDEDYYKKRYVRSGRVIRNQ